MPVHLPGILIRALALAVLPLFLAVHARAGGDAPPFTSPFGFPCQDDFIGAILADPNMFAGVGDPALCAKLCKQTAKECRTWAKSAIKCKSKVYLGAAAYEKVACGALLPGADDDCRALVKANRQVTAQNLKANLVEFTTDCADWGTTCAADCAAP